MHTQDRVLTLSNVLFSGVSDKVQKAFNISERVADHVLQVAIAAIFASLMTSAMVLMLAESTV